jgi:hypothetical protein
MCYIRCLRCCRTSVFARFSPGGWFYALHACVFCSWFSGACGKTAHTGKPRDLPNTWLFTSRYSDYSCRSVPDDIPSCSFISALIASLCTSTQPRLSSIYLLPHKAPRCLRPRVFSDNEGGGLRRREGGESRSPESKGELRSRFLFFLLKSAS